MTKLESNIYDAIETVSTITCSKCRKTEDYHGCDDFAAVEVAINNGWYATDNNCYCPTCDAKRGRKKNAT